VSLALLDLEEEGVGLDGFEGCEREWNRWNPGRVHGQRWSQLGISAALGVHRRNGPVARHVTRILRNSSFCTCSHSAPILTRIFNQSLRPEHCPASFRASITAVLRKPGKANYAVPKAYCRRPSAVVNLNCVTNRVAQGPRYKQPCDNDSKQ
jgi:hypothetical protein